jgi:LPS-assembly protein
MPRPRVIWLVLAWLALGSALAEAQERRELSLRPGDTPVTVFADRIESIERDRLLIAEGRVEIEQGEIRLEADRVEVNTETGEAVAIGRVLFFDGRDRLRGERLEYSFRSGTGIVYQGEGFAEPHFFFGGERLERLGEKAYRAFKGVFTTCEAETPAWSVRWGQATAYLDDYMWGTNASFWVWKIPLVPFIPVFYTTLRRDRHTGFLTPTFGTSSEKGFTARLPFFWAISDSQDLLLVPTFYENRGFGLAGEYRYIRRETSRGELEGFGLYDTEREELRGVVGLKHDEQITPRLNLRADLAYVSDDDFLDEFGNTLDERSRIRLESNLSVTQRWNAWNLVGRLFFYEDLTTDVPVELQRLPEIRLDAFTQPVPGLQGVLPGLLFELESSYNNFVRDVGSDGQRLDLRPRLSYPVSPGGFFTVRPRIGVRETIYDTKVIGTMIERGFLVEDTDDEFTTRSLFEASVDLEARAFRVFEMGGALGIERLQHAIEPRISYNVLSGDDSDELPQFDGIDFIRPSNSVTYSLINRLKARAVPAPDGTPGRVWELGRLTLSQTYDAEEPPMIAQVAGTPIVPIPVEQRRLSDLTADLILEPLYGLRFRGTTLIDPYDGRIRTATTDTSYETTRWLALLGTRHGDGGRLQFVQGSLSAQLGSRWAVRFASNYDVESGTVIENRFEVDFREQCWAVTVALVDRTDEDEFRVTISLLELGQYALGRALGRSAATP